jgi:Tfp pilus assembly protein PilF
MALDSIKVPEILSQERDALEKAIQLKPGFAAAENQLGILTAAAGETAAAEQHFRNALAAVSRYAEAANNLGTLLGQKGRDTEAESALRSAVSANPRYTRAWINLAATLASQSRFPEARGRDSALKIDPKTLARSGSARCSSARPGTGGSSIQGPAIPASPGIRFHA